MLIQLKKSPHSPEQKLDHNGDPLDRLAVQTTEEVDEDEDDVADPFVSSSAFLLISRDL